jgi:hypothetical protein
MQLPALTPRRLTGVAALACAAALIPMAALAATASRAAPGTAARASATATSSLSISVKSATLVANGAAIRVVFTATCPVQSLPGTVGSTTTQAARNAVAQGTTQPLAFTCTGKPQQESALATATLNGAPFHPGVALVTVNIAVCDASCTPAPPLSVNKVLSISG